MVAGVFCIWAGARAVCGREGHPWPIPVAAGIAAVCSFLENPFTDLWSGGFAYLGLMLAGMTMATVEFWFAPSERARATRLVATTAGLTAAYFLARWLSYAAEGAAGEDFKRYFGPAPAGVVFLVLLITASFSMSNLSHEQLHDKLRRRAEKDHLTGLLNRGAFLDLAGAVLSRAETKASGAALILADLDHFKAINDDYGHAAGDAALKAFAKACSASVRSSDVLGRYGGEEFIALLPGASQQRAEEIASEISDRLAATEGPNGMPLPTVSYGVTSSTGGWVDLAFMISVADAALYSAKAQGRDRVVGDRAPHAAPDSLAREGQP